MKTAYGLQVDAWGALIIGKGALVDELKQLLLAGVQERGLERLRITEEKIALDSLSEAREHIIFQQDLGQGGLATVALRIARKGKEDLEISWRLFEKNVRTELFWGLSQGALIYLGLIFIGAGIIMIPFGGMGLCGIPFGLFLLGTGLGWWKLGKSKTTASTYQQFDTRSLVQIVDYALMRALASKGVTAQELRVLQRANMSGLGNLAKTDLTTDLIP
jgi:hypothetical protein